MGSRVRDPKRIVEAGYDEIAVAFREWAARVVGDPRERLSENLAARLAHNARLLDLGCGAGASAAPFVSRFRVTGVDVSAGQLELARARLPEVDFVRGDITELELAPASFDAVTAFYSLTHVPRVELGSLFGRIATWLVPGGYLLASLGVEGSDDWSGEWLGTEMFFSSWDADTNRALLRDAGFELVHDEIVEMLEPEGPVSFLWVIAQKVP